MYRYFFKTATKIIIVGTHKNHLAEADLMGTHNVCFLGKRQFDFTIQMQETWFSLVHGKLIFTCISMSSRCLTSGYYRQLIVFPDLYIE